MPSMQSKLFAACGACLVAPSLTARIKSAAETTSQCKPRPSIPPVPQSATEYNGISWPEFCFEGDEEEHIFIIGDWGGLDMNGQVFPAPNTGHKRRHRRGLDDKAQKYVAEQMSKRADVSKPRLVLNGGDNFYWGGIKSKCGKPMEEAVKDFSDPNAPSTLQFKHVFEDMYSGASLENVPWLGCFGNHDYGGFQFNAAWDQQIAYTWGPTKRWILPAQYWHQHVDYPSKDMTVDVYMIDTCNQDTADIWDDPGHNICSRKHNWGANCKPFGPESASDCVEWFKQLWRAQLRWMEDKICASNADWQIIVTHFPPEPYTHYANNVNDWRHIGDKCGIDLFIGSHRHDQEMHQGGQAGIPYLVAGGGGGITSERTPGDNTQYGFFDMTVTKENLAIISINQYGHQVGSMNVHKRFSASQRASATNATDEAAFLELDEETPPGLSHYDLSSSSAPWVGNDRMPDDDV